MDGYLQPVNDGLVDNIRDYPGYNCFEDAISGTEKHYRVVKWKEYNDARRWNPNVSIDDYTELCTLKYEKLPGYENLSQEEYKLQMRQKLAKRTQEALQKRKGKPSLGAVNLKTVQPGARPKRSKTSGPQDHRPRVLSKDHKRRSLGKAWYFQIYWRYKAASKRYRNGEMDVEFPKGTYKPPLFTVAYSGTIIQAWGQARG